MRIGWGAAMLLAACGGSSASDSAVDDAGGPGGTPPVSMPDAEGLGGTPPQPMGGAEPPSVPPTEPPAVVGPTYWQDIRPLLMTECGDCHAEGEIGAFDLGDPGVAAALAPSIAAVTADGRMPPFPPGPLTPPLRDARRLTAAQIELLGAWAEAGAPLGEPDAAAPAPRRVPSFDLQNPDLVFNVPVEPYSPDVDLPDDYRCFMVPLDVPNTRGSVGYRVTPGNPAVVHHMNMYLFDADEAATLQALDDESPDRDGWPCFSQTQLAPDGVEPAGFLGFWVPGVGGVKTFEGTARPVPANTFAVLNVHYNTLAWDRTTPDRTRVEVYYAPPEASAELQPVSGISVGIRNLEIPWGEAEVVHEQTGTVSNWTRGLFERRYADAEAWAVGNRAHMHLLATSFRITRNLGRPDEQVMLDIPRWDFHWQSGWRFEDAHRLRADDTLTVRCVYDNTPEHRAEVGLDPDDRTTVAWGEGTTDEMCGGGLELVDREPEGNGAPPAPPADPDACNAVVIDAPEIQVERSNAPLPSGRGGVPRDGHYHMTRLVLHGEGPEGPLAATERVAIDLRDGVMQIAGFEPDGREVRETKTFAVEGANFTWTGTCPTPVALRGTFEASGDTLWLYYTGRAGALGRQLVRVGD
jgi:hypothetical protein